MTTGETDATRRGADTFPSGTTLSHTYEIVDHIALGGMAEVYRARNIHTGEPVAIKVVLPEFARDETILALFKKEATVLSRLHHDAIVHYHLFTIEQELGRPYLVMEYVDGVPLSDMLAAGPLPVEDVRLLLTRIASGLGAAHDLGVVHRDLSPDNVILPNGDVKHTKIIDFGIAKAATIGEGTLLGGKFAGKYNFVSPEQLGLYGGDVTERSDIYSLGLIGAAAVRGKALDMSGSHAEVLEKRRGVPDLSGIDPGLAAVFARMLEPDPAARPADMQALIRLLEGTRAATPERTAAPERTILRPATPSPREPTASPYTRVAAPAEADAPPQAAAGTEQPRALFDPLAPGNAGSASESPFGPAGTAPDANSRSSAPPPAAAPRDGRRRGPMVLYLALGAGVLVAGAGLIYVNRDLLLPGTPEPAEEISPPEPPPIEPEPEPAPVLEPQVEQVPSTEPTSTSEPATPLATPEPAQEPVPAREPEPQAVPEPQPESEPIPPPVPEPEPAPPAQPEPVSVPEPEPEPQPALEPGPEPMSASTPAPTATPLPQPEPTPEPEPTPQPEPEPVSVPASEPVPEPAPELQPEPQPEPSVESPAPQINGAARFVAWLESYPLGECQYATATSVSENSMQIEAYGDAVDPFQRLDGDFQAANGFSPDIGLRLVDSAQCAAVDFLRETKRVAMPGPILTLSKENIANGEPLLGRLEGGGDWTTDLLLVGPDGQVRDVSARLTSGPGGAGFTLPLVSDTAGAVPMMLIAVSSATGLASAMGTGEEAGDSLFARLLEEISTSASPVAVSSRYFKLGG